MQKKPAPFLSLKGILESDYAYQAENWIWDNPDLVEWV